MSIHSIESSPTFSERPHRKSLCGRFTKILKAAFVFSLLPNTSYALQDRAISLNDPNLPSFLSGTHQGAAAFLLKNSEALNAPNLEEILPNTCVESVDSFLDHANILSHKNLKTIVSHASLEAVISLLKKPGVLYHPNLRVLLFNGPRGAADFLLEDPKIIHHDINLLLSNASPKASESFLRKLVDANVPLLEHILSQVPLGTVDFLLKDLKISKHPRFNHIMSKASMKAKQFFFQRPLPFPLKKPKNFIQPAILSESENELELLHSLISSQEDVEFDSKLKNSKKIIQECYQLISKQKLPNELSAFLESHKNELEEMRKTRKVTEPWEIVGSGACKIAIAHPDLPNYVIKIAKLKKEKWLLSQFKNIHYAKHDILITGCKRLVIPDVYFISNPGFLVETKLQFTDAFSDLGIHELSEFLKRTGFRDILLRDKHNANFIVDKADGKVKVAIYDLDKKRIKQ